MTEEQALYVQKLKVEQKCSYPTIARLFHTTYGSTDLCNPVNDATSVMYYDSSDPSRVKVHELSSGSLDKSAFVVDYIFSADIGIRLCRQAMSILPDVDVEQWSDFDES